MLCFDYNEFLANFCSEPGFIRLSTFNYIHSVHTLRKTIEQQKVLQ